MSAKLLNEFSMLSHTLKKHLQRLLSIFILKCKTFGVQMGRYMHFMCVVWYGTTARPPYRSDVLCCIERAVGAAGLCVGGVWCVQRGSRTCFRRVVWRGIVAEERNVRAGDALQWGRTPWGGSTEVSVTPLHPPRWVMATATRHSCQLLLTAHALTYMRTYTHTHTHAHMIHTDVHN